MALVLVERRSGWALPPRPPESWVGGRWTAGLVAAVVLVLSLSALPLRGARDAPALGLVAVAAVSAVGGLVAAYVLLLQASVTGDARLRWVGSGFAAVVPVVLLRAQALHGPGRVFAEDDRAAALTLVLLGLVPAFALSARRGLRALLVPLDAFALLVLLLLLVPLPLVTDDQEQRPVLRLLLLGAALLAAASAVRWTRVSPDGVRGPWGWVAAGLGLLTVAGVLHALAPARYEPLWWAALGTEAVALAAPALGLSLFSAAGYRRQSRRWRQLVHEVSLLRAASPLLPGLSVTPEDDEGLPEHREVRALIDAGRVRVALQPVVRLEDGVVVGHEALSRFGGRVPTDRWFRGANLCGLGGELERMTLQAALALLPTLPQEEFLAVNVSPAALEDEQVLALLHGCDLTRIVVEVTEHEAVLDYSATRRRLQALRDGGARVAVDDTGAGFASLRHVLMLQPDVIKLDASLTRDVHSHPRQRALVIALATFAASVGSVVLAEGIETEEQLQALRGLSVPFGQGWHLGVPTVVEEGAGRP